MKRGATSGIHHKKRQVEASTSSQKLVKALDYYVVIVTGWKHHYYTGWPVYFVVWHVAAWRWRWLAPGSARVTIHALHIWNARILFKDIVHINWLQKYVKLI